LAARYNWMSSFLVCFAEIIPSHVRTQFRDVLFAAVNTETQARVMHKKGTMLTVLNMKQLTCLICLVILAVEVVN
jgi:hypothetical protein